MVIPDQTITGVSGLGANTPGVLRRTAERIPDQLNSQPPSTLHPFDGSLLLCGWPIFPPPIPAYLSTSRHTIIGGNWQESTKGVGCLPGTGGYHRG